MKFDIKGWGIILLGTAALASLGFYLAKMESPKQSSINVSELITECVTYNSNPGRIPMNRAKIQSLMHTVETQILKPKTSEQELANNEDELPATLRKPLQICIQDLKLNLEKYQQFTP